MTTWILLRGLTRERRHWGGFPGQLAGAFPGARVVPLELPGNGELNALASPASIAGLAAACRGQLALAGVAPPYFLLGMSLGAMVATAWAANRPEEVAGCVLVSTSFGGFSPPHQRLRPGAWPALLAILATRAAEPRERRILDLTSSLAGARAQVVAEWAGIRRSRPVSVRNGLRQLLAAARYRAPPAGSGADPGAGRRRGPAGGAELLPGDRAPLAVPPGGAPGRRPRPAAGRRGLGRRRDPPVARVAALQSTVAGPLRRRFRPRSSSSS